MLNIKEVEETIAELENSPTTLENCRKLASLYTVSKIYAERHKTAENGVFDAIRGELHDILPTYDRYKDIKRKYQMKEVPESAVETAMTELCTEIREFIQTLYGGSDLQLERDKLHSLLTDLGRAF